MKYTTGFEESMKINDRNSGGGKNNSPYLAERAFGTDMCHVYKSFNIGWANTGLWGCFFTCGKMQLEVIFHVLIITKKKSLIHKQDFD